MATETPKKAAAAPGREPVRNKRYEVLKEVGYTDSNQLALTDRQQAYLSEQGLTHRFVYEKEYLKNNNFHRSQWKVVADPDMPGANSDGLVKVGDLVMAVKTKEQQAIHRQRLADKAKRYADPKAFIKQKAADLKATMSKVA
jgi:hypothetical protein